MVAAVLGLIKQTATFGKRETLRGCGFGSQATGNGELFFPSYNFSLHSCFQRMKKHQIMAQESGSLEQPKFPLMISTLRRYGIKVIADCT